MKVCSPLILSFGLWALSGNGFSSATYLPSGENLLDEATQEARRIADGNKEVSELFARLIQKDAAIIFAIKQVSSDHKDILSVFKDKCGGNLDCLIKEYQEKASKSGHH